MFLLFYVKRANALSLSVLINTIEDLKKDKQLLVLRHLNSLIIPLLGRDYLRDLNLPPQRFWFAWTASGTVQFPSGWSVGLEWLARHLGIMGGGGNKDQFVAISLGVVDWSVKKTTTKKNIKIIRTFWNSGDEELVCFFFVLFCFSGGGKGFSHVGTQRFVHRSWLTITIPYLPWRNLTRSCVVAIKMKSLYFVTLKNFYICV